LYEDMSAQILIGALLVGTGIGFVSGAFGKGGSALATPLLHMLGVPAIVAVASPLPATIPSTLLASRSYGRAGHIDRRVVRLALLAGVPATIGGALCTPCIPGGALVLATDVLVLALGLRVLLHAHAHSHDDTSTDAEAVRPAAVAVCAIAAIAGVVSGLLGNSGGFLLAPLFVSVLRMPMRRALGSSLVISTAFAVPGTVVHAWLGHIDWSVTLAFGLGAIPLATMGARAALRLRERTLALTYGFGLTALAGGLLVLAH
jgi:uncharacterized protein